jgi:hypothetical protein
MTRLLFPALAIICLAACGQKDTDAGPGGVSVGEARALDEAASMLDQQRLPPAALASGAPAPQPAATPSPKPSPSPRG